MAKADVSGERTHHDNDAESGPYPNTAQLIFDILHTDLPVSGDVLGRRQLRLLDFGVLVPLRAAFARVEKNIILMEPIDYQRGAGFSWSHRNSVPSSKEVALSVANNLSLSSARQTAEMNSTEHYLSNLDRQNHGILLHTMTRATIEA